MREVLKNGTGDETGDGTFKPGDLIMSALRFSEEEFRERLNHFIREQGLTEAYSGVSSADAEGKGAVADRCISKPQEQFIRHVIRTDYYFRRDVRRHSPDGARTLPLSTWAVMRAKTTWFFSSVFSGKRGIEIVYTEGTLSAEDIRGIHSVRPFTVLAVNLPASEPDDEVKRFCNAPCP